MSLDTELYLVMVRHSGGDYFPEQNFADATSKANLKKDIRGWQYDGLSRVFCFNPAEGWSRDVSEDIAREINDDLIRDGEYAFRQLAGWIEACTGEDAYREMEEA
jgi:hypothetical protein